VTTHDDRAPRVLGDRNQVVEAIKAIRESTIEDRKQILIRVGFVVALVAFTFKDLHLQSHQLPLFAAWVVSLSVLFMLVAAGIYFLHHNVTINVLYRLAECLAYATLTAEDLAIQKDSWRKRRRLFQIGSLLFYFGAVGYLLVLLLIVLFQ